WLSTLDLHMSELEEERLIKLHRDYIQALMKNIEERFKEIPLLEHFSIFNPLQIPDRASTEFQDYGSTEILALRTKFLSESDSQEVLAEYGKFKYDLIKWKAHLQSLKESGTDPLA
ncbi:unnamed protein product, partial [Owenia fusiformis]